MEERATMAFLFVLYSREKRNAANKNEAHAGEQTKKNSDPNLELLFALRT